MTIQQNSTFFTRVPPGVEYAVVFAVHGGVFFIFAVFLLFVSFRVVECREHRILLDLGQYFFVVVRVTVKICSGK